MSVQEGLLVYIILAGSIAVHEWGHAIAADKLGDLLPRSQGRVTLNPLAHLDPIGTGLIPLIGIFGILGGVGIIGWGRPVQINPNAYKNRIRDHLLVTAAGPAANIVIALIAALLGGLSMRYSNDLTRLFLTVIQINSMLVIFNMIPIPPLDGSHFMRYAVGMKEETFMKFSRYGIIALLVLINIPPFIMLMHSAIMGLTNVYWGLMIIVSGLA